MHDGCKSGYRHTAVAVWEAFSIFLCHSAVNKIRVIACPMIIWLSPLRLRSTKLTDGYWQHRHNKTALSNMSCKVTWCKRKFGRAAQFYFRKRLFCVVVGSLNSVADSQEAVYWTITLLLLSFGRLVLAWACRFNNFQLAKTSVFLVVGWYSNNVHVRGRSVYS